MRGRGWGWLWRRVESGEANKVCRESESNKQAFQWTAFHSPPRLSNRSLPMSGIILPHNVAFFIPTCYVLSQCLWSGVEISPSSFVDLHIRSITQRIFWHLIIGLPK